MMGVMRQKEGIMSFDIELGERKAAREILTMIEEICFSEEYGGFRINQGSNGQRDLIITKIKERYSV